MFPKTTFLTSRWNVTRCYCKRHVEQLFAYISIFSRFLCSVLWNPPRQRVCCDGIPTACMSQQKNLLALVVNKKWWWRNCIISWLRLQKFNEREKTKFFGDMQLEIHNCSDRFPHSTLPPPPSWGLCFVGCPQKESLICTCCLELVNSEGIIRKT